MSTSQTKKILEILMNQEWHCTNEMYAAYIADPRSRLSQLKKQGYNLEWRWCQQHAHNKSKEWRLREYEPLAIKNEDQPIGQAIQRVREDEGQLALQIKTSMQWSD